MVRPKPMASEMTGEGVLEWRDGDGRLHRDDGPARVFPSGREEWYRHGRLHRDGGVRVRSERA